MEELKVKKGRQARRVGADSEEIELQKCEE